MINGKQIGCIDFIQSAKKIELKIENIFLKGININALNKAKEEQKVPVLVEAKRTVQESPQKKSEHINSYQLDSEISPKEDQPALAQSN